MVDLDLSFSELGFLPTDSVSIQNQQANYCGSFTYTVSVTPLNGKTPSTFKLDPAGSKSFQVYSGTFA